MQARRLVAYGPRRLDLEAFELADSPPPGQVLLEMTCTLISTGTELANWTAQTAACQELGADWRSRPYRPGYSAVGVVKAVGAGVETFRVGERVCGEAGHASAALVPVQNLAPVPDSVTDVQAAFATLLVITMHAVRRAGIALGERVASVGLGLIGNLALQQARLCGALVAVGTDLLSERRRFAEQVGLTALDPTDAAFVEQVGALSQGQGFDVVFEATGSPAGLAPALRLARRQGRVIALGSTRGLVDQFDLYTDVHRPGVSLIGAHMSTAPDLPNESNRWTRRANRELALELLAQRRLEVERLVTHREPPERGPALFTLLADRRGEAMAVLLDWR